INFDNFKYRIEVMFVPPPGGGIEEIMNKRLPDWLKIRVQCGQNMDQVEELLSRLSLHTVCEEANCPNLMECFSRKTATFMILGRVCTRNCTFCNVTQGSTERIDCNEPLHVAQAVKELGLKHVVVTSVTRDDLPDGGAGHYYDVIGEIRKLDQQVKIEVLIPDFLGSKDSLEKIVEAKPDIMNHNVETIPRLYPTVRPMAVYNRSLELLRNIKLMDRSIITKSGMMVGLGEEEDEVIKVFKDLRDAGCDMVTVGQYLAPTKKHHPVIKYIHPDVFEEYRRIGLGLGFIHVAAAPLVRSSYKAELLS
ncbi:MAG TPA: lipoyl synthase, partial [Anaerovoracaceae bacterium]|nr:lipoyl synthase [Anaerovoracaceae bacterium]